MSLDTIYVTTEHPLSPFHVYQHFSVGDIQVTSIAMAYYYIILRQDGYRRLARDLLSEPVLLKNPTEIGSWLRSQGYRMPVDWLFRSDTIYLDILVDQVQYKYSRIGMVFMEAVDSMEHPWSLKFVFSSGTNNYVWACGLRVGHAMEWDRDSLPGFNMYGEVLTRLSHMYLAGNLGPKYGVYNLLGKSLYPTPNYNKTVLLLSDSQCRYVESISGGVVISVSGGTFRDLAREVRLRSLRLGDFALVIINCGVNDCQRPFVEWQRAWRAMHGVLEEQLKAGDVPKILISTAIPFDSVPHAADHANWLENKVRNTDIEVVNWAKEDHNPFIGRKGKNLRLLEHDKFHISHAGFREQLNVWAGRFKELKFVEFTLSEERHAIKRDSKGNLKQPNGTTK